MNWHPCSYRLPATTLPALISVQQLARQARGKAPFQIPHYQSLLRFSLTLTSQLFGPSQQHPQTLLYPPSHISIAQRYLTKSSRPVTPFHDNKTRYIYSSFPSSNQSVVSWRTRLLPKGFQGFLHHSLSKRAVSPSCWGSMKGAMIRASGASFFLHY